MATTRKYQSIGEVLVAVKTEFPDITISKIRFLESEGLIEPERTPSGYRKFYEQDVERLRHILKMQRDEYLPLKVIKERLAKQDAGEAIDAEGNAVAAPPEEAALDDGTDDEIAQPATGLQMSIEEMSSATGVERERILELEQYGLVRAHGPESARFYDGDDYIVLSILRDMFQYGIEPRHLGMYKNFEEREASFFETIVMPSLRQRNPDARRAAVDTLNDLSKISRKLKAALLRVNLREYLHDG
ncbi:MAG: MerR family transcriptional regulator [Actinomycetota bacterium]